jgi:hypothetical protein
MIKITQTANHLIYYSVFLLVFINLGFFLGFPITKWHLPLSLTLYFLILITIKVKGHLKIGLGEMLPIIFLLAVVLIAGWALPKTYDTSYDGQLYHQTAVISLSTGWNPIWNRTLPISAPTGQYGEDGEFGKPFVIGYPKSLWSIQSAIFLFNGRIQTATITNLIAGLVAFIYVVNFLMELKICRLTAIIISTIAVLGPHYIIEFTSCMPDGFIYQISLVAIVSLTTFLLKNRTSSLMIFCFASFLLAGTKFNSLPLVGMMGLVCLGYLVISGLIQNKYIQRLIIFLSVIGIIMLFLPFGVNQINYGSPLYPGNLDWAKQDIINQNIPKNLRGKNAVELLFYGIFSQPQISTPADDPANLAYLKLPFTFSKDEITQVQSERVGTGGVFFSGLVILSSLFFVVSIFQKQSVRSRKILIIMGIIILLIIITALSLPAPNVLRFTPQICLIPIITLSGICIMYREKKTKWLKYSLLLFSTLIVINTFSTLVPIVKIRADEFKKISQQLVGMKNSHITYNVYAQNFYSSYLRLQENNVKFIKTANIGCQQPGVLERTFSTSFCPLL